MKKAQHIKHPKRKRRVIFKIAKWLLVLVLLVLVFTIIALIGINRYLQSNETKILDNLPFLNNGTITFDEASISIFKDFPSTTLSLTNVVLKDSLFDLHQRPVLELQEIRARVSLVQILDKHIFINSIQLQGGIINMHTDENNYNNLKSLLPDFSKKSKSTSKRDSQKEKFKINTDHLGFSLKDVAIHIVDEAKKSSIKGRFEKLSTTLNIQNKDLSALIDMELFMEELAFDTSEGAFVPNSKLVGTIPLEFKNGILKFEPFDLKINEELFVFNGQYDTNKTSQSSIILENKETRIKNILPLLPPNIRKEVSNYQIEKPFYSKTSILSFFRKGDVPVIDIEFRMVNNDLRIFNIPLNDATLNGRFVNRIYDDERSSREGKNRIRVVIESLKGRHEKFHIETKNALITNTPEQGPRLEVQAKVNGPASSIHKWLKNDQFFFEKGQFTLRANVQGPLQDFNQMVIETDAFLHFNDLVVVYGPANVSLPIEHIDLSKKSGDAEFTIISSTYRAGNDFRLDGGLENLPALIFDLVQQQSTAKVNFVADRMSWTDFLDFFGKSGIEKKEKPKTDRQKKKSMKETLRGIQHNFQPQITIKIDTLEYFDLIQLQQFETGLHFEDEHTIVLEKTSFTYNGGTVDFSGRLDINDPHQTPFEFELETQHLNLKELLPKLDSFGIELLKNFKSPPEDLSVTIRHRGILDDANGHKPNTSNGEIIFKSLKNKIVQGKIVYQSDYNAGGSKAFKHSVMNTQIELEGDPSLFNDFFKTEKFFFSQGKFKVAFDYFGNISNFKQLLQEGNALLTIEKSNVYYKTVDVDFPLTQIILDLSKDIADFNFFLYSEPLQQEIRFLGSIENLSELILGQTGKQIKTSVDINSPKLIWDQFLYLFSPKGETDLTTKKPNSLKATVKDLFTTFDPDILIETDTFIYTDKIALTRLNTGVYLTDSDLFVLDNTNFKFHDGFITVNGLFDLSHKNTAPFDANFSANNIDVVQLLEALDYVGLPSLKSIEKLKGNITMDLAFSGIIDETKKELISEKTKGVFGFNLQNVEIKGMPNLDTIASKIRMKKRFANLKFAPIKNTITIDGNNLEIPLMEIQSNALNLFIEGNLSYGNNTNIWVSVPLDNVKKADRNIIPEKRGYALSKRKVYIEVTSDEEGANQFKFRLRKKKFYKQRGILSQYRKDKRRFRKARKAFRKEKRRDRRATRKDKK